MNEMGIYEQLNVIYQQILKKEVIVLGPNTTAADVTGWDSLTHVMLISEIEKRFHVRFSLMEVMKFKNVGDLVALIVKKTT